MSLVQNPKLISYVALLKKWNKTINLVSKASLEDVWRRHIEDCAQLVPFLKTGEDIVDVGAGAGLPGLVLGVLTGSFVHLIEADARKALFLEAALKELGLKGRVYAQRVESLPTDTFDKAVFVSRAFRPLEDSLTLLQPHLTPGRRYLTLKGATWPQELAKAQTKWHFHVEVFQSLTHPEGRVLQLTF